MCVLTLLLTGCHINKETRQQVRVTTAVKKDKTLTCPVINRNSCASETPLAELRRQAAGDGKNRAVILDHGEESLMARINLIRAAQQSIHIQSFIWVDDEVGQLMVQELLAAARRGVEVRIIFDQLFSFDNSWLIAELTTLHENLNIQLYNPVFMEAQTSTVDFLSALACCLAKLNRRMHNKTFIVDRNYGIIGGRNYQNRYYDWDPDFNYKDRDVLTVGPVVEEMAASFQAFWDSEYAVPSEYLDDVSQRILNDQETEPEWLRNSERSERTQRLLTLAGDPALIQEKFVAPAIKLYHAEYFSDSPDKPFNRKTRKQTRQLTNKLRELLSSAKQSILMQTPYLVFSRQARKALKKLRKKNPDLRLQVSTNSLSSTDAFYVYAISFKHKRFYLKTLDMHIYEYKDRPGHVQQAFANHSTGAETRYGMHAKSFVIDGAIAMIGSHNFDPRSEVLNTENGLIIYSLEFARALEGSIRDDMRPQNSWVVAAKEQIPVLSHISGFMATVSRKLPFLDIWPFRYSTSYELRQDAEAVEPGHPQFHQNYEPVGNFPNVPLSSKQIQTIIISAFAGFAEPVM